jgi:pyruvate-formate lyase-activating enzyme
MVTITLNYGGYIAPSTVDWFGISSGVLFFRGCLLKCNSCQNPSLIKGKSAVSLDRVKEMVTESKLVISGVVFSGGEPCQQIVPLTALIDWCKGQGLKTYLHTSGNCPENLKTVITRLDGVRIDYKPREQLTKKGHPSQKLVHYNDNFTESVLIIRQSGIDYIVSAVALQSNTSLKERYKELDPDPNRILIVQGNEDSPKPVRVLKSEFPGCWLYSREEGLKPNFIKGQCDELS